MSEVLVDVKSLWKKYARTKKAMIKYGVRDVGSAIFGLSENKELRADEFWSLKDISFQVKRGEIIGLCGHNGAGKTTLLKTLSGLLHPDRGSATIKGRVAWLVDIGAGLNGNLSGRENVELRVDMLDMRSEMNKLVAYVEEFTELSNFLDSPVSFYSSGMKAKLGFAIATMITPDVLIVDETLAVGDLAFRMKCYSRIAEISKNAAILFVSHGMNHVARICNSGIFMNHGEIKYKGDVQNTIKLYHDEMTISQPTNGDGFNADLIGFKNKNEVTDTQSNEPIILHFFHKFGGGNFSFTLAIRDFSGTAVMDCSSPLKQLSNKEISNSSIAINSLDLSPGDYTASLLINDEKGNHLAISNSQLIRVSGIHGSDITYKPKGKWSFS